jgi:MGT family glycosyltransferase
MARILITTLGAYSHIRPFIPVATELKRRGHRLLWICDDDCRGMIGPSGAEFRASRHRPSTRSITEALDGLKGVRRAKSVSLLMLARPAIGQMEDCREALADFPADLILGDSFSLGPRFLNELGGPPWAILNVSVYMAWTPDVAPHGLGFAPARSALGRARNRLLNFLVGRTVYRRAYGELDAFRAGRGLGRLERKSLLDHFQSPFLQLQACTEAFEYPRRPFPPAMRFIGPLLPGAEKPFEPPPWWADLEGGRQVILITQGTVANSEPSLIGPVIDALAHEDFLLVYTSGGGGARLPEPMPGNLRVADFLPYEALLPRVSLLITNGGYGTVTAALSYGIPIIVSGDTEEKPEIARRIAWSGAGIDLRTGRPSAQAIRDAVRALLADGRYRRRAREIQESFSAHDAPSEAADHIEALLSR